MEYEFGDLVRIVLQNENEREEEDDVNVKPIGSPKLLKPNLNGTAIFLHLPCLALPSVIVPS